MRLYRVIKRKKNPWSFIMRLSRQYKKKKEIENINVKTKVIINIRTYFGRWSIFTYICMCNTWICKHSIWAPMHLLSAILFFVCSLSLVYLIVRTFWRIPRRKAHAEGSDFINSFAFSKTDYLYVSLSLFVSFFLFLYFFHSFISLAYGPRGFICSHSETSPSQVRRRFF